MVLLAFFLIDIILVPSIILKIFLNNYKKIIIFYLLFKSIQFFFAFQLTVGVETIVKNPAQNSSEKFSKLVQTELF